jgi:hypothetical protein
LRGDLKVLEKTIEQYLRNEIKAIGGKAYKFVSLGNDGVPDRLVGLPGGQVVFVETKAPGKKATPLQRLQQKRLRDLGFTVFTDIDSTEKVDLVVAYCQGLVDKAAGGKRLGVMSK